MIVSAWIKRPDELLPADSVFFFNPAGNRIVNFHGRVAVVGRVLRLELLEELGIFFFALFRFTLVSGFEPLIETAEAEVTHVNLTN